MFILITSGTTAYAGAIEDSKIGQGVKLLLTDLTAWAIGIGALVCVVSLIYCFIRKSMADEMEQAQWKKKISTILYCAVGIVIASPFLMLITSYFK